MTDNEGVKVVDGVTYFTLKYIAEVRRLASLSTMKRRIKAREIEASMGLDGQIWVAEKALARFLKSNPAA